MHPLIGDKGAMSKFDELCTAYGDVKRQYDDYRNECMLVVGSMVADLREYLDAPEGHISLYCKHGSWAGRKVDSPIAAMYLADDTFWHFGISMDLFEESGQLPFHTIGFDIKLKKVGHKNIVQCDEGPVFELVRDSDDGFRPLYDYMYQYAKKRYSDAFSDFILKGDATRRFGF